MKKSQITVFLFMTMLFGINVVAQTETPGKVENRVEETVSANDKFDSDNLICEFSGDNCRKRKEVLENFQN